MIHLCEFKAALTHHKEIKSDTRVIRASEQTNSSISFFNCVIFPHITVENKGHFIKNASTVLLTSICDCGKVLGLKSLWKGQEKNSLLLCWSLLWWR